MTRILDALKKVDAVRAPLAAPSAVAPLPAPGLPSSPSAMARGAFPPASALHPQTAAAVRSRVIPVAVTAALPEDVVREMTTLRVSIESALAARTPRTLMFMSAQGGEGTSTVASQFVSALAADPLLRALFLDTHARHPALGSGPDEAGPPAALFGSAHGGGGPRETGMAHGLGVDLFPVPEEFRRTGVYPAASAREVLEALSGAYDWVVMDGPPVLYSPDAPSLGAVADGVVIVVEAGRTKRPVLTRSVDLLRRAGARVLGTVLNRRRLEIPEFIYRRI